MHLKHSSKEPTIIDTLTMSRNINAKITLDNAIKTDSSLRQIVLFTGAMISSNIQNREPLFVVLENSRLEVVASTFTNNYSTTQGSIIKADYRRAQVTVQHS